jgi:23S rRNA (uracil1939-C5)-methyltransferase
MSRERPREVPVARGDQVTVDVHGLGDGPDGLARIDDYVVFVPGVLPGERAIVDITSATRKFGRGELRRLEQASPDRVEARCAHFLACGGCHRQHQHYAAQLRSKQARIQKAVDFALGPDQVTARETIAAAGPYGERHKVAVQLLTDPRGRLTAAFHRARSPDLVAIDDCPASDPLAWDLVQTTIELLRELPHRAWDPWFAPKELLRSVLVRTTTTGDAHVVLVATAPQIAGLERIKDRLLAAGASSISINYNDGDPARLLGPHSELVAGRPFVHEEIDGINFRLSPSVFFQTSPRMAGQIVQHVLDWLRPGESDDVADLYCGVGLLTLPLARRARSALGIELHGTAVDDARASALANGIGNVLFRCGQVDGWLRQLGTGGLPRPTLVALDPPRTGLTQDVIASLQRLQPRKLAYVSCDPLALQRDLRDLLAAGFRTVSVTPFDMFPQTCHVESLACLELAR